MPVILHISSLHIILYVSWYSTIMMILGTQASKSRVGIRVRCDGAAGATFEWPIQVFDSEGISQWHFRPPPGRRALTGSTAAADAPRLRLRPTVQLDSVRVRAGPGGPGAATEVAGAASSWRPPQVGQNGARGPGPLAAAELPKFCRIS
jgi:hypothetical protein